MAPYRPRASAGVEAVRVVQPRPLARGWAPSAANFSELPPWLEEALARRDVRFKSFNDGLWLVAGRPPARARAGDFVVRAPGGALEVWAPGRFNAAYEEAR